MHTNPIIEAFAKAIETKPLKDLPSFLIDISGHYAEGHITENEYAYLDGLVANRRSVLKDILSTAPGCPVASVPVSRGRSLFPVKKPSQRSPNRAASLSRRRKLAAFNPLPSNLEWCFTTAEQAVLAIVRNVAGAKGMCALSIPEIAARAGVSETTVRSTLKEAVRLKLIVREERRLRGRLNLTNVLWIVSEEWLTWINRGPARKAAPKPSRVSAPTFTPKEGVVHFSEPHVRTDTYRMPSTVQEYAIG